MVLHEGDSYEVVGELEPQRYLTVVLSNLDDPDGVVLDVVDREPGSGVAKMPADVVAPGLKEMVRDEEVAPVAC